MNTQIVLPAGMEITGALKPEYGRVLTPAALAFVGEAAAPVRGAPAGAARRPRRAPEGVRRRQDARLPAGDEVGARVGLEDRRQPQDMLDRRVEITGPDRPQDGDQRAQLRRLHLHGGLRGRQLPDLGQHDRRARSTCATRCAARSRFEQGGKQLQAEREDRGADPAPARLAPGREARAARRQARLRRHLRFRALLLPQREGAARARLRARTSTCRRWSRTSRRACGTTSSWWRRTSSACPHGSIKATVLIETVLAAFEMDEILWELREHSAGLNIGRWDYIFSCIKKFRSQQGFLPRRPRAGDDDRARSCAPTRCCW